MNLHPFTLRSIEQMEAKKKVATKSIHPFGRAAFNMSKAKSPGTIARVRHAIEGHLARHPRDGVAAAHLAKLA